MKNIKKDRFMRVAYARKNKIIDTLRLLGNCSTPSNYEYDRKEVNKIFAEIDDTFKKVRQEFDKQLTTKDQVKP